MIDPDIGALTQQDASRALYRYARYYATAARHDTAIRYQRQAAAASRNEREWRLGDE